MNRAERRRLARELGRLSPSDREFIHREVRGSMLAYMVDQLDAAGREAAQRSRKFSADQNMRHFKAVPSPALQEIEPGVGNLVDRRHALLSSHRGESPRCELGAMGR